MKSILFRRRVAGVVAACLVLAACVDPDVSVTATDFGDDSAYYLILSDQLQRVRNVLKEPAIVCATVELHDGIAPVPPDMLDRLASEQANNEIPLTVASTYECLVHYTRDKGRSRRSRLTSWYWPGARAAGSAANGSAACSTRPISIAASITTW